MRALDSYFGAKPVGGDRRPRMQQQYTSTPMQALGGGYSNQQLDNYEGRYGAAQYHPPQQAAYGGYSNQQLDNYERNFGGGLRQQQQQRQAQPMQSLLGGQQRRPAPAGYGGQQQSMHPMVATLMQMLGGQRGQQGGSLMTNEQAALGGGPMPHVTAGGAYGRQDHYDNTDLLHSLLGLNGHGGTVHGGSADPGTLGALRGRMPAPWMNGGQQQMGGMAQAGPGPGFDATGTAPATLAARMARVGASGGRLGATPSGGVTGNYFVPNATGMQGTAVGGPGIDATAMVQQNHNALFGFSPERQREIMASSPQAQTAMAQRQLAYQQRQQAAESLPLMQALGLAEYSPRQQQAMQKGQARDARLAARKAGPSPLQQLMGQYGPDVAMQAMHMQNQNQMLGTQLGLQNRQADQGDERNRLEGRKLTQADEQFGQKLHTQLVASLIEGGHDPEEAMQLAQSLGLGGRAQGQPNSAAVTPTGGRRGAPSKKDEAALLTMTDPIEKRNYMRDILKLSPAEITARLRADHKGPTLLQHALGLLGGGMRGAPNSTTPEGPMMPAYGGGAGNLWGLGNSVYQDPENPQGEVATNFLAAVEDMFTGKKRKWRPAGFHLPGTP